MSSTPHASKDTAKNVFSPPALSLPKGGGAIRGIDEKFSVNPANGTASFSIPITTTPGRTGFGPELSLNYNSGAGNGPFGLGWSLSLPAITRKTDKGLPQYRDAEASDIFILSGAEDLMPVLADNGQDPKFSWNQDKTYKIFYYRPRIEGLFSRIEKWVNPQKPEDTYWRSISKDNVKTYYGKTPQARMADPEHPERIFEWLIEESRDDKGNVMAFIYKRENDQGVSKSLVSEKNRLRLGNAFSQQYLKSIQYTNKTPNQSDFLLKVVFDYGEHADPGEAKQSSDHKACSLAETAEWLARPDPFSQYRAGFEVRTYRLCQRVLMFHCFPELDINPCLVHSTDFTYEGSCYSYLKQVRQLGYLWDKPAQSYAFKSLPPLDLEYTEAIIQTEIGRLEAKSQENLPAGLDHLSHWIDFRNEGIAGILTEQADAWYYKSNLGEGRFTPAELVASRPQGTSLRDGQYQLMDLAGEGRNCLVRFSPPVAGYFQMTPDNQWEPFTPFASLPNMDWHDPNLKLIDLNGDGFADLLLTEDHAWVCHLSQAKQGFEDETRVPKFWDEEQGPALVFADAEQCIYLADISGDGLADIARIRNGEICYWPNLGYGRFGAKVAMDHAPLFDTPDGFDHKRIRLADIDATGTTDIIYLGADNIRCWFNQSGNGWSREATVLPFPAGDNFAQIEVLDFLGKGTACLVWSSTLPSDVGLPLKYLDLMGEKPHLLKKVKNNLGKETVLEYASSTKFYLADKAKGTPWITKLPFPVHVVERVVTYDRVSRNGFSSRYAYHHGYFDGVEREFRGFGLVEEWDAEEIGALQDTEYPSFDNIEAASYVPPVLTKTWFHTGAYFEGEYISRHMAAEYYGAPDPEDKAAFSAFLKTLLPDTILPMGLTREEAREACRSLKGAVLRQEIYGLDGTDKSRHPYTVSERNYGLKRLQAKGNNPYAVFLSHPAEILDYSYERNPDDPRLKHTLALEVDGLGHVLKSVAIGYGRKHSLHPEQTRALLAYTEKTYTNAIDAYDDHRIPLLAETCTYELTGYSPAPGRVFFIVDDFIVNDLKGKISLRFDGEAEYEQETGPGLQRRLVSRERTYFRADRLDQSLALGAMQSMAIPAESYHLAFTSGLIAGSFQRKLPGQAAENLLPLPADLLGNKAAGAYADLDGNGYWWAPSGRICFSPDKNHDPQQELAFAQKHFFLPGRYYDPFGHATQVAYDGYDLFVSRIMDAAGNQTLAEFNYRAMQPELITDANGNRSKARFDILGWVAGTAIMGKDGEGDSLEGFSPDLSQKQIHDFCKADNPHDWAADLLGQATTRSIYDFDRYRISGQPALTATLARETHVSELKPGQPLKIQIRFGFSDGFGREIQKKIQAEPENEKVAKPALRWVGSGWTVFDNKGNPVKTYEPFFSPTHDFEFARREGVASTRFYDPLGRPIAVLHSDHTFEKTVFDPWRQMTWDANDTVQILDPKNDPDIGCFFRPLPESEYLPTWYGLRTDANLANQAFPDPEQRASELDAAVKAAGHAGTFTTAYYDVLGRSFLTEADNGKDAQGNAQRYATRLELDLVGNQRSVTDSLNRVVMRQRFNLLRGLIKEEGRDSGDRWYLNDASGKLLRHWDGRGHAYSISYDALQRPCQSRVEKGGPHPLNHIFEKIIYGENQSFNGQSDRELNLRGKVFIHYDTAGRTIFEKYDFKGNVVGDQRRLIADYKRTINWDVADPEPLLETETFRSERNFDAFNRISAVWMPDASFFRSVYNAAGLLENIEINLRGQKDVAGEPIWTPLVENVDYNAKGQRTVMACGNGVETSYEYDPRTFRLTRLRTLRSKESLQDLFYAYDPAGNITSLRDKAQPTIFFKNQQVDPNADYTYDAIYRLIQATGREHLGQTQGRLHPPRQTDFDDAFRLLSLPGDGKAMGNYTEKYLYDEVGNILEMAHQAGGNNWTRQYLYEGELAVPGKRESNRLVRTQPAGPDENMVQDYGYDAHGNMTAMPHLSDLQWDFRDQLLSTTRQVLKKDDIPETTYYIYDHSGRRARKVTESQGGIRTNEILYVGGFEICREYGNNGKDVDLEWQTLHVSDDRQRIALVETKTIEKSQQRNNPPNLIRYQFANHLGSACLELDGQGQIISYEEFYPFGSTSYQAVDSQRETSLKRYRYNGKERDKENGLYYYGARYYAPWLGRWTSTDPAGMADGTNVFTYVRNSPVRFTDSSGSLAAEPLTEVAVKAATHLRLVAGSGAATGGAAAGGGGAAVAGGPLIIAGAALLATVVCGVLLYKLHEANAQRDESARQLRESQKRLDEFVQGLWLNGLITDEQMGIYKNTGTIPGVLEPGSTPSAPEPKAAAAAAAAPSAATAPEANPKAKTQPKQEQEYDPKKGQRQGKQKDREISRKATLEDRQEQARTLPSTIEGMQDLDRLEDKFGPEAREHLADEGKLPEGDVADNHHPTSISKDASTSRRGGRLVDKAGHYRGFHQRHTERDCEPGASAETAEGGSGYEVYETDRSTRGRKTDQMSEEDVDAFGFQLGDYVSHPYWEGLS